MALDAGLGRLSTRSYPVGLEPVGVTTEATAKATSKSVSRRFLAATETALRDIHAADLSGLDLVAFMVDGAHFGEHCVVALGIGIDGTKHPLALVGGSTENATRVKDLLVGTTSERGLDVTRPILAVIDGAKALRVGGRHDHEHMETDRAAVIGRAWQRVLPAHRRKVIAARSAELSTRFPRSLSPRRTLTEPGQDRVAPIARQKVCYRRGRFGGPGGILEWAVSPAVLRAALGEIADAANALHRCRGIHDGDAATVPQ